MKANWRGKGHQYRGTVARVHADDATCDILYDDGDWEARVPAQRLVWLRRESPPPPPSAAAAPAAAKVCVSERYGFGQEVAQATGIDIDTSGLTFEPAKGCGACDKYFQAVREKVHMNA